MVQEMGVAALAGCALMILLMPIEMIAARAIGRWAPFAFSPEFTLLLCCCSARAGMVKASDHRVKLMNEILQGIRVM